VRPSTTSILVALLAATSAPLLSQANTWESGIVKISARNGDSPATGFVVALRNNVAWIITSAHVREFIHSEAVTFDGLVQALRVATQYWFQVVQLPIRVKN
jgi:hypothetical protein